MLFFSGRLHGALCVERCCVRLCVVVVSALALALALAREVHSLCVFVCSYFFHRSDAYLLFSRLCDAIVVVIVAVFGDVGGGGGGGGGIVAVPLLMLC